MGPIGDLFPEKSKHIFKKSFENFVENICLISIFFTKVSSKTLLLGKIQSQGKLKL
jgi:hypothetical protein